MGVRVHYKELRDGIPVNILVDGDKRLSVDMALIVNGKEFGDLLKEYMEIGGNEVYKDQLAYYKEKYG